MSKRKIELGNKHFFGDKWLGVLAKHKGREFLVLFDEEEFDAGSGSEERKITARINEADLMDMKPSDFIDVEVVPCEILAIHSVMDGRLIKLDLKIHKVHDVISTQ